MKKEDLLFVVFLIVLFVPFFIFPALYDWYISFNRSHTFIMAFLKFAILATTGEMLGLRIKTGQYNEPGFGVWPRAVIWGVLGIWIAMSMKVFSGGAPVIADYLLGKNGAIVAAMQSAFSLDKLIGSFMISLMMNTSFAPVFMTIHKITDTHILNHGGKFAALFEPIPFGNYLAGLNWKVQWNFVFKKTIPYFWLPAHTITFILPADFQVLFAALLGIALGVILSIAAVKSRK